MTKLADSSVGDTPLTESQKVLARGLYDLTRAILEGMRAHGHKSPPVSYLATFLLVVEEQGLSVEEYAGRAKRSASVISRHLLDIGDRNRKGEPGLGLVTSRPNPNNRRRLEYLLTPKGRALAKQIKLAVERIQEEMRSVSKSSGEATKPPPSPD